MEKWQIEQFKGNLKAQLYRQKLREIVGQGKINKLDLEIAHQLRRHTRKFLAAKTVPMQDVV